MFINDIKIDWVSNIPTVRSSELTEHPVELQEIDNITSHIKNDLPEFSLQCILTGDDRNYKFERINKIWEEKAEVTIKGDKIIENLRITYLEEDSKASNAIEFEIYFKKIVVAKHKTAEITADVDKKAVLKSKEKKGKKKVTPSRVNIAPVDYEWKELE